MIIVKRYDREFRGGAVIRHHQEDLCQALGLPPGAKYARHPPRDEDPSLGRLARILAQRATDPPRELLRLLKQITVSIAMRNADAHAKNLSLVHDDNSVRLSPIYDVAPTTAFLPRQTTVGLSIGGKSNLTEIGREHLVAEAVSWGVPKSDATDTIESVATALQAAVERADELYPSLAKGARDIALAGIFQVQQPRPGRRNSVAAARSRRTRQRVEETSK